MKIAISSTGRSLEDSIDARFGRCPYFLIIETENKEIKNTKVIKNNAGQQISGAGLTAGEIIGNEKPDAVITMNIGPKAFQVFNQLKIEVYQGKGKIRNIVDDFLNNKLKKIGDTTGPMHMSGNN